MTLWEGLFLQADGLKFFIDFFIKSTLLLLAAAGAAWLLRRASAAVRHWVWSFALVGVLVMPILAILLPSWQLPILPDLVSSAQESTSVLPSSSLVKIDDVALPAPVAERTANRTMPSSRQEGTQLFASPFTAIGASPKQTGSQSSATFVESANNAPGVAAPEPAKKSPVENAMSPSIRAESANTVNAPKAGANLDWGYWLIGAWGLVALVIISRLIIGLVWVRQMSRRSRSIEDEDWHALLEEVGTQLGLQRSVRLFQGFQPTSPMTWGVWRPVVLLPQEATSWPQDKRRVVLMHELAHVKRRDTLTQMLAQLVCALFWFHPLVWVAARRLRIEREYACDDQVLQSGTKASAYASCLLDIALNLRSTRVASLATLAMSRKSQLEGRLMAILNPGKNRGSLTPVLAGCLALVMLVVLVPLAAIQPWAPLPSQTFQGRSAFTQVTNALPPSYQTPLGPLEDPESKENARSDDGADDVVAPQSDPLVYEALIGSPSSNEHNDHNHDYEYNFNHDYDPHFDHEDYDVGNSALGEPFVSVNEKIAALHQLHLDVESGGNEAAQTALQEKIASLILHAEKMLRLTTLQLNKLALKFESGDQEVMGQVKDHIRDFSRAYRDTMHNLAGALEGFGHHTISKQQAEGLINHIQAALEDEVDELSDASGKLVDAIDSYVETHLKEHLGELGELIAGGIGLIANQIKIEISVELRSLLLNMELFDLHAGSRVIHIGDRTIIISRHHNDDFERWIRELRHLDGQVLGDDIQVHISMDEIEQELESMLEGLDEALEEVFEDVGEALEHVFENLDVWLKVFKKKHD